MNYEINIAVVGSGYWGKNLVRNFHELGALKLICDKNEEVLARLKGQYSGVEVWREFADVLHREDIRGIVIATPAETHFNLAREALAAGKHVFVEKPLALTEKEGHGLVALAERQQLILMVGHVLQYHPGVIKLKELVDDGALGKIYYLYSNRLNIGKVRAEENILWSFAPHDISVILMLLGEMPESVCATGGSYLQERVPDTTLTTLDFRDGVKAHIFVSWLHPFKEQKLVVVGDKKMAVFDDVSQQKLLLYSHKIQWLHRVPVAAKVDGEAVAVEMEEPLKTECEHFLECIAEKTSPRTDGWEGLRVLQVLQASQLSLDRNGTKIPLPKGSTAESDSEESAGLISPQNHHPAARPYFVHESSYVDDGVEIGEGTKIWHFSHVLSGSHIGKECNIGQNVVIGPEVSIGDGCKIQNNVSVYKGVVLEEGVFCGPSVVFTNVYNPRSGIPRMKEIRPTLIRAGATLGANSTIVCGTTIGKYAFVGAGAVVKNDVPDHAMVAGNPAVIKGWVCECGGGIEFKGNKTECKDCRRKYRMRDNVCVEAVEQ